MYLKIKGIYKYIFIIYIFIFFVKGNILALPAFPGASGYGANTRGAYSGSSSPKILKVDSASSFKSAISYDKPRIIIFTRGGTYDLGWSDDRIYNPYVTIAGQTAPGDGVCLKNGALRVDAHSVIIRGLRWRTGLPRSTGSNRDCIGIEGKDLNDIIIDHNSLSWASDEIAVSWDYEDRITWSWNIISEGIGTHGYGLLAGTYVKNSSIHHNLFAHLVMRMPECNNGTNGEIISNVMYHWEGKATDFITGLQFWDVKKNFYKQKADQSDQKSIKIYWPGYSGYIIDTNSRFYITGNVGPGRPVSTTGGEWDMVYMEDGGGSGAQYTGPLKANASVLSTPPVVRVAEHTAEEAYKAVLEKVGASAPMHDDVDRRVINDVKNGTGTRPDSVSDSSYPSLAAGSYPTDSDDDGMPDTWEIERGLNPNYKKDAHSDRDGDGYKNIEEYINGCFPRTAVVTASPVSIKSNGTDSSTIRVEIRNECDVVDKPYDRQITFAIANGIGKFSNGQTSYTTSAVKGVATASFTSNTVGTSSITVTPAGINSQIVTVKVYSYSIEITANPTTFEGNGTNKSTIVATIKDASGNIYNTNDQVNFTVSGPGRLPGGATSLNVSAVSGIATTEITSNGGAGTIVVTALYSSALPVSVNIIATPSANSPIGEWRFEEGTGTTAADTSGGNNNGILVNSPTWLNGKVGKALQFDGLNTYVTISDSNVLDLTTGISIEAWVKTDVITTDGGPTRRVLDKGVYVLAASDQAYFKVVIGGANKGVGKAWTSADVNSWHHLIGTYDGATVKLYQDGTLAGQTSATGNIDVNGNPLIIGRQGTSPAGRFDGVIDEVKIYNRALSASEVLEHYQGMVPPPVDNPPQVALVVPNNNSVVSGIVAIEGTATDDNGIGKVCFYIDDVIKSTDTTAPYTYSLDTTQYANGTHTIKLIATDTIGQTANAQINISVDNAVVDIPPTIIITSLGDGDTISDIITIEAAANDDNGINSVAFYIDNELRSTDTTSPYTYVLDTTQLTNGSHIIKVIASDTLSQTAITQITVLIDNTTLDNPPTINIVTPNNNSVISGIVTISGTANDDNGISSVGFYIDNVIKSTDTTAPYAYSLDTTEYANGTHTIKLIATDTNSQTATTQITITIDNIVIDNPPQVTITSPTNNSVISGIITINATATDDNGIGKVCFYMNNVLKSTDTTSPYTYNLDTTEYTNGTHTIKLIATDTIAQSTTTQITISINNTTTDDTDDNTAVSLSPAISYLSIEKLEGSRLQISWLSPESDNIIKYNIYMSTGAIDYSIPAYTVNYPEHSKIIEVRFEYKGSDEEEWQKIPVSNNNHPNPDNSYPYFIKWNVSELDENNYYNVRVIVVNKNGLEDTTAGYITIGLDSNDPDIEESRNYKRERIDNRKENIIMMGEPNIDRLCEVKIGAGVLEEPSTMIKIIINPSISATISKGMVLNNGNNLVSIGYIHKIDLENGQRVFSKDIEISLPYNDKNNDNIIDEKEVNINKVFMYSYNEDNSKWEKVTNSTIDKTNKKITSKTRHLSYYGLFMVLSSNLSTSHIYANPYKPSIGHASITFANLTTRTKVQIYNTAGELVYDDEKDTPAGELIWNAKNNKGEPIASGIYIYMITNNAGQIKKGKLAIIR